MNNSGQTLLDVVIAMAVGGIVSLGIAAIITFGMEQFNNLRDQNLAEENLMRAGYFLRVQLSNAVKTYCCNKIATCNATPGSGIPLGYNISLPAAPDFPGAGPPPSLPDFAPAGIPVGVVDCRAINLANLNNFGTDLKPLAVFVRENGDTNPPSSSYLATGIFFQKPTAPGPGIGTPGTSGILYFADADANGFIDASVGKVFFDRLVNIGVEGVANEASAPPSGSGAVANFDLRLRARYFKKITNVTQIDYRPEAVNGAPNLFRDIDMVVSIPFRNNIIGYISNGGAGTTAERIHGGIYYFKYSAPQVMF